MKWNINYLAALSLIAIGFIGCKKEDQIQGIQLRPKISYSSLTPGSSYLEVFKDSEGNQTVDFSGQTFRQDMMAELDSVMRIATGAYASRGVAAGPVTGTLLKNMYA